MFFNSLTFLTFFIIVYALYLGLNRRLTAQNVLLLIASYVFYGYWDWRFLILILISTLADYTIGRLLERTDGTTPKGKSRRKFLLICSITINLTILGFFKYFNFFAASFASMLGTFGFEADYVTLNIVLPVGISFYTFQTMSYTIDVYRKVMNPTRSLLNFGVFVAFFPQLVAGPIERAKNMLPQIEKRRHITPEQLQTGFFLIVWGYFKKVFIADNVAQIADQVFNNYQSFEGLDVIIGTLAFAIQIYCDFSGYSDIARGLARLMGFELMINFKLPYFANSPSDFWQRWHISLSTWLRDYLYFPLGGNRKGTARTYVNLFVTMLLGGLWHGAAWNFVIWGGYHGLILIIYRFFGERWPLPIPRSSKYHYPRMTIQVLFMFTLTLVGWLIFRSSSAEQVFTMLTNVSLVPSPDSQEMAIKLVIFSLPLVIVQVIQQITGDLLAPTKRSIVPQVLVYTMMIAVMLVWGARESIEFIYFQF